MIERILLAVDDSPAALHAAQSGVDLAVRLRATVRAVNVVRDGVLAEALAAVSTEPDVSGRQRRAAGAVLRHVRQMAGRAGVPVQTEELDGEPGAGILAQARKWPADLIVLGRPWHGSGLPYLGSVTQHVLEFAEQPVLVVPVPHRPVGGLVG